jgi:2-C-methyl-D-erythritol 2,4-cyclodiphosphate synthase
MSERLRSAPQNSSAGVAAVDRCDHLQAALSCWSMTAELRIGHGFDVHRFERGRKLILGGVEIPHSAGLVGHSDADVLLHSLMNALLGAMAEGDIGAHFPDTDPQYKDISSEKLLARVVAIMGHKGFELINADVTVVAQEPKLANYYAVMRENVARCLNVAENQINIKATTTEKLGWAGREEGIAATAVVLLRGVSAPPESNG